MKASLFVQKNQAFYQIFYLRLHLCMQAEVIYPLTEFCVNWVLIIMIDYEQMNSHLGGISICVGFDFEVL